MEKGGRRSTVSTKFNRCVKSVRKTVKARRGSSKESAAIAICTTTVLHPRKRTLKSYRRGRLVTQKRRKMMGGDANTAVATVLKEIEENAQQDVYDEATVTVDPAVAAEANTIIIPALEKMRADKGVFGFLKAKGSTVSTSDIKSDLTTLAQRGSFTEKRDTLSIYLQKINSALPQGPP